MVLVTLGPLATLKAENLLVIAAKPQEHQEEAGKSWEDTRRPSAPVLLRPSQSPCRETASWDPGRGGRHGSQPPGGLCPGTSAAFPSSAKP